MDSKLQWAHNQVDELVLQLEVALDASGIGLWHHNIARNQTRWDERLRELYGVGKAQLDIAWLESLHPDDRDNANEIFERAIATKSDYAAQFRIVLSSGEIRHIRSRAKFFVDGAGEECFIGAEWDITEDVERNELLAQERETAERSRAEAKRAAEEDHLTGLPNRRAFDAVYSTLLRAAKGHAALCHIDVDHFKEVNDRFGHVGGDIVLQNVAAILSSALKRGEIAARLGGDEFAILIPNGDEHRAQEIMRQVRKKLSTPMMINGDAYTIGISTGIACADGNKISSLLASSDVALYEAKNKSRNRDEVFTPALAARLHGEKLMLKELRRAIGHGEIVPHYQVQVRADDFSICGLEALARWETPGAIRLPSDFLPLASANGLIEEIDDAILRRVVFDIQRWTLIGLKVPRISVNLSASRLAARHLADTLHSVPVMEGQLSFELLETIFLDTLSDQIRANINSIRSRGIEIEIDDLGSGHASLLGLLELRPDRVKIDRQLVLPVLENPTQRSLIRSLIDIAKALNMKVVAEGVETLDHAHVLTALGADVLQGYAFGRPEPAAKVVARLGAQGNGSTKQDLPV
ncbi:putative bifunctional diguanylate cyclase/phosphodiesterase [Oryzifoliimicrobium ureilyticus]|uniref:putative bifunctional diguanylate cyclase/phosphodiesterase n=1 Tax=Oryzifoliimicrobium ureilyticus TaxID=3113724 RepID=UPI0030761857